MLDFPVNLIEKKLRCRRWISCCIVLLFFVLSFLIPFLIILTALYNECVHLYQFFPQFWSFISDSISDSVLLNSNIVSTLEAFLENSIFSGSENGSQLLSSIGYKIRNIFFSLLTEANRYLGQILLNLPKILLGIIINLYLVFFLLMRGENLYCFISWIIPLEPELKNSVILSTKKTLRAIIYGTVIIGLAEGIYGGAILYCLGYQSAILWGALMTVLSMIPVVGTNTALIPLSIFQLLLGNFWDSFIIIVFGVFGVLFSQNVIRVKIVGDLSGISLPLLIISTIGGITQWGIAGFVVGPIIASIFFTFLSESKKISDRKKNINK